MLSLLTLAALAAVQDTASPRARYWQQEVAYDIEASVDDRAGVLTGRQRMTYVNRSPDTLRTLSFHLHLNAFRPHSAWSARDAAEGRRRFNDLGPDDHGFQHVRNVTIGGAAAAAEYPYAPDSTLVRFTLAEPLAPGARTSVTLDFDARPSTVARRQGRRGRHLDFAHWYPNVVVYDRHGWQERPLEPAGEFYGEWATYDVTLEVAEDQVLGATGVPVCGDPGWARANAQPGQPVRLGRDAYAKGQVVACTLRGALPGRKLVQWRAEQVHHFALTMNPEYRYEGGEFEGTLIHVLYRPGDERSWGGGVAVQRTAEALRWLRELFGPFAWPQITNVHRIDGGGTEFPMMMHNGSASLGLILHELGHNYTMGLLANNEWREGWLDEGFTSFQSSWYGEVATGRSPYAGLEGYILDLDLDDRSEPTSLRSDRYRDFGSYNTMIYARGELFFHQLRTIVGDEAMRRILRTFYERWKFRHVDEAAFREVAEEVSGRDLSAFFAQWLHGTTLYDFSVGTVRRREAPEGGWITTVEVRREAPGQFPVEVQVIAAGDTATVRADGIGEREVVEVRTRTKPREVRLDPRAVAHDWNMLNNVRGFGLFGRRGPKSDLYFDTGLRQPSRRDRKTIGLMPLLWWNDAGGLTLGLRTRENYLGRFEQNQWYMTRSLGSGDSRGVEKTDFFNRMRNPVAFRSPNLSQTIEAFRVEGRYGGRVALDWRRREHDGFGPEWRGGIALDLVGIDETRYLDPGQYEDVGIAELTVTSGVATRAGKWALDGELSLGGGLHFSRDGLAASGRELDEFYGRAFVRGTARRGLGGGWQLAARLFGGVAAGADAPAAKQRQFYLGGADPLAQLRHPLLRSRGAPFAGRDVNYHAPGDGNVRAVDARVSAEALTAANVELERSVLTRRQAKLFNRVALAGFGDAAVAFGEDGDPLTGDPARFVGSFGIGVRIGHRLLDTPFVTRFDVPFYLSRPEWSRNGRGADERFAFRWVVGLEAAL